MANSYKLIYRGEVQEGQHAAVVKKRLGKLLKLEGDRLEMLFTGKAVVLKKSVDEATAARFQAAFKKSGAVLRVARNAGDGVATATTEAGPSDEFELLPVGSDLLAEAERTAVPEREVDTSHIKLAGAVFSTRDEPLHEDVGPDVSHIDIAEPGVRLGPEVEAPDAPVLDVNFDLADIGVDLGPVDTTEPRPPEIAADFELAEPGARIGPEQTAEQPTAPDTSHIQLKQQE